MKIGVLGAGTWGMALARMLANDHYDVMVWSAIESEIDELSATRAHKNLPGMVIPQSIVFTKNIEAFICGAVRLCQIDDGQGQTLHQRRSDHRRCSQGH